jgi:3-hydroxyisobutyrate dehydrogenase
MASVGFLGLGAIGRPMARRIALGKHQLSVWNRTPGVAREVALESGAREAASPAEAARGAEVLITCLPTSREVEALLDGAEGIITGLAPGSVMVDCTSGDPPTSRRIAQKLAGLGIGFLDAPVSGGTTGAEQGTLTVMCGGDRALFDRVLPVLESFGRKIVHCGDVGAGDALKAVNNALLAVHIWSAAEGLAALTSYGVRADVALDVINASSGRSNASMNLIPERVLTRAFPRTFRLALLEKDVAIAADLAREQRVPAPVLQLTTELLRLSRRSLGEEADHVEMVKVVEEWSGVEIGR